MAKINSQLENAQMENKTSDYSVGTLGRMWVRSDTKKFRLDRGDIIADVLLNDDKLVIGTNGTAANNVRIHRGANGRIQLVDGDDTTTEGTMSVNLAELSSIVEAYTDAGKPSATVANKGRIIYISDLDKYQYNTAAGAWKDMDSLATTSTVDLVMQSIGDFSSNSFTRAIMQFPWTAPTKMTAPTTPPAAATNAIAVSPNGEYIACAHPTTPFVTIYQKRGTEVTKLANPGTLPTGTGSGAAFSPNGEFLAIAHTTTPFVTIYQRSGSTFTKLTDPGTLPAGNGVGAAWSPCGEFLTIAHATTPFVTIYQRSGTTFTKLANPGTLPAGNANAAAWSKDGRFLAIGHATTPFVTIYERTAGTTFTKLTNPATLPSGVVNGAAFSNGGEFLALAVNGSGANGCEVYQRSGTTFTKLSALPGLPSTYTATGQRVAWSANDKYLYSAHSGATDAESLTSWSRSGTTFTKLTDFSTTDDGYTGLAVSPDNQYVYVGMSSSPFFAAWQTASNISDGQVIVARGVKRDGVI